MAENISMVADRVALKIKKSALGEIIDEDDLLDISKKAIEKAFFERVVLTTDSYGRTTTKDPVILELAREVFSKEFKRLVEPAIKNMTETTEFREVLTEQMVKLLPKVLYDLVGGAIVSTIGREISPYSTSDTSGISYNIKEIVNRSFNVVPK